MCYALPTNGVGKVKGLRDCVGVCLEIEIRILSFDGCKSIEI